MSGWLGIIGMACALSSMLVAMPLAQERTDPGAPPDPMLGGSNAGWQMLSIPGLPAGATFCDVLTSASGVVHVWAYIPPGINGAGMVEDGGEGEKIPDPSGLPRLGTSLLYRFDGTLWTVALRTPGEDCRALYGDDTGPLFASTVNALGEAQVYAFDGNSWRRVPTPGSIRGELHTFAGVPGDMYFRVGRTILHHDGNALTVDHTLPAEETPVRGLAYFGPDCLFAMGTQGHYIRHQGTWWDAPAGFSFDMVEDAWGMREADGFLHMFAVGSDADRCELRLWSFREDDLDTHAGQWLPVLADPPLGGTPGAGEARHLWGVAGNEVYATGVVAGEGHIFRFDGTGWAQLIPPFAVGTIHGVWGTAQGVVWFTTESGKLLRYQRDNRAPDLSAARPSVDRLWPDDLSLVPLHLQGIVDPEGDAVSIVITRITQDEPLVTDGHVGACPDATVTGNLVHLRAEHMASGDGRTYGIEFTATDRLGAMSRGHVYVFAPHSAGAPVEPDPMTFDSMEGCPAPLTALRALQAETTQGSLLIRYALDQATPVHLGVYDISGRVRAVMAEGVQGPGMHEAQWNLDRLEPGVYFVKLRTIRGTALVQRVVVMR